MRLLALLHRPAPICALAAGALWFGLAELEPARAQPVLDLALSDAQLVTNKNCTILRVNFNLRVRYASHFPIDHGQELRITVNAIDRDQAVALQLLSREAVRPPDSKLVGIRSIDFETRHTTGSVLRILFDRPVAYQVAQSADVQSIVIAIAGATASPACRPEFPLGAAAASRSLGAGTGGRITDADVRAAAAAMDEARAALKKNDPNAAIALTSKVIKLPENEYSADAHELLGVARQRSGQIDAARAEYETYLSRYPDREGSERVRQRLDSILTAGEPSQPLKSVTQPGFHPPAGLPLIGSTSWIFTGSASEFYIRDDSFRTAIDPSLAPDPNADPDAHQVHQNEALSSLDLTAAWNSDRARGKIRFSGTEEHHFGSDSEDRFGIAALFSEVELKDWHVLGRVGRQVRNTGGVLGRFDGGLVSWEATPLARLNVVAGSPVASRFNLPFMDQRYFYGASVDLGPALGGFETTLFGIEQRDRWLVDREAVGAEFRYFDQTKSAFSTIDYDLHFQQLNAAIFSGSWTLPDQSTIYGGADYRKTPYLSTWNALLNQPFATLYDILRSQSIEQVRQLAIDQTPTYKSAMVGFSHPLTDRFQVSADATVVNLTQPVTLSNIDPALGTLPAGNEYYLATQLTGSNLIKEGDMYIAGLRYSRMLTSNMYVLDFNTRYPLWSEFSISPRLRLGYRTGRGIDLTEYTALPSILINYSWTKELSSEFEIGGQRTWTRQYGIRETDSELFLTLGIRYDFFADGAREREKRDCATPAAAALCRYSNNPEKNGCGAPCR